MQFSPRMLGFGGAAVAGAAAMLALRPLVPSPSPPPALVASPAPRLSAARHELVVYVAGAVAHPGVYAVPAGARAGDAVRRAGGARPDADLVAVNLAAPLADGDEVAVRRIGETAPRAARTHAPARRRGHGRAPPPAAPVAAVAPVDLNRAAAADLAALPGIGANLAERIVAFRDQAGPFTSLDGLLDVAGMTPSRLDRAAPFLTVQP